MIGISSLAPGFVGLILTSFFILAIYRLFLHPLAKVPGPKLAAITGWYEFYFDCFRKGQYVFKIQELHEVYGPVVRINPWEVHISDPEFFQVFYSDSRLDKDAWFYRAFGDNGAAVGTASWELHKARRGAMAKFFSVANVNKLEPKVLARVQTLLDRMEEHRKAGKVVDISNAFRCYATDVISDYAAPHGRDFLRSPDFSAAFNRVLRDFSELMLWHRHFPVVFPIMNAIPRAVIARLDPTGASVAVIDNQAALLAQAKAVVDRGGIPKDGETPTVLDAIYTSPLIGPEDKTLTRILAETQAILGAGTETTGNTLSVFTYHVLSQQPVLARLQSELHRAARQRPSPFTLLDHKTLENLPYLQACLKESLRLATGVSSRLPRQNHHAPTTYTPPSSPSPVTYTFPPGTTISMSILDLHYNPSIFPNPESFTPTRWIDSSTEELQHMERAFKPFGVGVRQCVGLELAREELLLMMGNLILEFGDGMRLFETTERDVSICHDYFAPFGPDDSRGVRLLVV
ncbi:hypothetical protein MBLNU230_g6650t1 [Neophaeotheca triangularis]